MHSQLIFRAINRDADTNAAVAGALLGARIGYNNLPKEWVAGIKYSKFLDDKINQLWKIISNDGTDR